VCDQWQGCAQAAGNTQDGWFVEQSDRVANGEIAGLEKAAGEDAFRLVPEGVVCAPVTIPVILPPPSYACVLEEGRCKRVDDEHVVPRPR